MTVDAILAVARSVPPWAPGSGKRYISDIAAALGMTTAELAPELLRLHRETPGGLLARCDLVQAADPAKLARSTIRHLNSEYDFVVSE